MGLSPSALPNSETRHSWCGGLSTDPEGALHGTQALTLLFPQPSRAQKRRRCCTARAPTVPEREGRPRLVLRGGGSAGQLLPGLSGWTSLLYLQLPEGLLLVRVCIPCWCQGPAGISLHGGALRVSPSCRDLV